MRLALFSGIGYLAISRKRLRHGDEGGTGFQPSCFGSMVPGALPQAGMVMRRWRVNLRAKGPSRTSLGQRPRTQNNHSNPLPFKGKEKYGST